MASVKWILSILKKAFLVVATLFVLYIIKQKYNDNNDEDVILADESRARSGYVISQTWDGQSHHHANIILTPHADGDAGITLQFEAPFFNDPPNPGGKSGEPFPGLWDFEVVEAFFLNDQNQYLEVELSPHGQHLVLLLNGVRTVHKDSLPLDYSFKIEDNLWKGEAKIPADYFPKKVTKWNAYAIHGTGEDRVYEALYPVPHRKFDKPDFHRLDYFEAIDMTSLLPVNTDTKYKSKYWS